MEDLILERQRLIGSLNNINETINNTLFFNCKMPENKSVIYFNHYGFPIFYKYKLDCIKENENGILYKYDKGSDYELSLYVRKDDPTTVKVVTLDECYYIWFSQFSTFLCGPGYYNFTILDQHSFENTFPMHLVCGTQRVHSESAYKITIDSDLYSQTFCKNRNVLDFLSNEAANLIFNADEMDTLANTTNEEETKEDSL